MTAPTAADIRAQIGELDADFESEENVRTGRLKVQSYTRQRSSLVERQRALEMDEARAATRRSQTPPPTPRAAPTLTAEETKRFKDFATRFAAANDEENVDVMCDIIANEDFRAIEQRSGGPRSLIPMMALSIHQAEIKSLKAKVAELVDQVRDLQARPSLKYVGALDPERQYNRGEFVTHKGHLWHCNESTREAPPGDAWTLAVRKGHDGRDAKDAR